MTKKEFEEWRDRNYNDYGALIDFANANGCEDQVEDIVPDYMVDDLVRNELDGNGWTGVANLLCDIVDHQNDTYYTMDGYGTLTLVRDWDDYADDIESNMDFDELCCDDCGEYFDCVQSVSEWLDDDELVTELQITEEEKTKLLDNDDGCDRCIDCFKQWVFNTRDEE